MVVFGGGVVGLSASVSAGLGMLGHIHAFLIGCLVGAVNIPLIRIELRGRPVAYMLAYALPPSAVVGVFLASPRTIIFALGGAVAMLWTALMCAKLVFKQDQPRSAEPFLRCGACDYPIDGLKRCPECGGEEFQTHRADIMPKVQFQDDRKVAIGVVVTVLAALLLCAAAMLIA